MNGRAVLDRKAIVRRGRRLEYFTIAWNSIEGLVAVVIGLIAGSISLVGFGLDSFIEVTSGSALLWRMSVDADAQRRERNEKRALRIVGLCFLLLAVYIAYESSMDLVSRRAPKHSLPGIILACVSLIVMPFYRGPSETWAARWAVRRCTQTPNKLSFAPTYQQSCREGCERTRPPAPGGPIPW